MMDIAVLADHRVKSHEGKKWDNYLDFDRDLNKHESDDYTNCNWCSWYSR